VLLRDFREGDRDTYLTWIFRDGRWKQMDAPWDRKPWSDEEKRRIEAEFREILGQRRRSAVIVDRRDGAAVGWVACYPERTHQDACEVGINICEDDRQGYGLGSEALALWVNHLFESRFHRVAIKTYSFNGAMRRTAEKLGFKLEGVEREIQQWEGKWMDRFIYGVLASEWRMPDLSD
jgi:RimJ/RimL family protein N-acetyltransferase